MHSQCLSFIDSGKAHEGKAKLRTGLGKSDRPGSQGGLRKRELLVELGTRRTTERVRVGNSPPKVARAVLLSRQLRARRTLSLLQHGLYADGFNCKEGEWTVAAGIYDGAHLQAPWHDANALPRRFLRDREGPGLRLSLGGRHKGVPYERDQLRYRGCDQPTSRPSRTWPAGIGTSSIPWSADRRF